MSRISLKFCILGTVSAMGGLVAGGLTSAYANSNPTHVVNCYSSIGGSQTQCTNSASISDQVTTSATPSTWTQTDHDFYSAPSSSYEYVNYDNQNFSVTYGNPSYDEYYAQSEDSGGGFYSYTGNHGTPLNQIGSIGITVNQNFTTHSSSYISSDLLIYSEPSYECASYGCNTYTNLNFMNN